MYHSRILPTNQLHGRGGGRGLADRTRSGNPGGAGSGPGRNTTTPTGMFNSGNTKFKCGDMVRLLTNCGRTFPAGTIVQIIDIEAAPQSATKRPGQDVDWTGSDEDSVYRFQRFIPKRVVKILVSLDFGDDLVSHSNLAPALGQPCAPRQYDVPQVLYTKKAIRFKLRGPEGRNREPIWVPMDTTCNAVGHMTLKNGPENRPSGRPLVVTTNTKKCFYSLEAKYLTYDSSYEICSRKKEVSNFQRLTASELQDYEDNKRPASRVINWEEA
uniref:Protein kinase domain-containing protein n=1 Tax=Ganoderma boninense TaxID=34458 RepID=A0A5K1K5V7_9APHY|nr:Protein kinase domain-containing protein [Ganoderma boninense]